MKTSIEAGVIYLALAGAIGWLWLTGAGASGVAAIQAAIGGTPDPTLRARLRVAPYSPPRPKARTA